MNRKLTNLLVNIMLSVMAMVIYVALHIIGHDFYMEFQKPTTWGLSLRFVIYDAVYIIFPSFLFLLLSKVVIHGWWWGLFFSIYI